MKTKSLTALALCLLIASPLSANSVSKSKDVELLRQEIQKQEIVLQALKEKLQRIEENKEDFFEISLSETGLQVGEKTVSREELETELKALPDGTKIMIRAVSTVKQKQVVSVMELCAKADLTDIVFATIQAEPVAAGQRR